MFTDDETGEIIKNKMFNKCVLSMEGYDKSVNSFISLKHKSNENNCTDGVYWLSLEGVQTFNTEQPNAEQPNAEQPNVKHMETNKYQKYPNLSNVYTTRLILNGINKSANKFSLSIYAISRNCATYWLMSNGASGMEYMYSH
jgi:hypothetical protein